MGSLYVEQDSLGQWELRWFVDGKDRVLVPLTQEDMEALVSRLRMVLAHLTGQARRAAAEGD
jgi:hypothetical protein